ncbi:MAG: D-tyrosyl-tRNA(Tyr) deacylase [Lachnospiraceae bacterium]|nr:D-tyrosyl-tRNA(Tyr) deacylase [Lachnospiraceae bacterium]
MRFLVQRVSSAEVRVDGEVIGAVGNGFLVLIGISGKDTKEIADRMVKKLWGLRIFADEQGKTNRSLADTGGSLLLVSQFTLYADCRHGNRPGFTNAALPADADALYQYIIGACEKLGCPVETGSFGADMKVSLVNDGPFTVLLDSDELFPS